MREDGPVGAAFTQMLKTVAKMYPIRWRIADDFLERSHFERVISRLDWTSSPGYPYMRRATNNRILFGLDEDNNPNRACVDGIWAIVQRRISGEQGPDPIRLFIKAEAHSARKLEREKYRLISSVSVVDQIVDHMLFDECNDKLLEEHCYIPNKPGWSPFVGGWRQMPHEKWLATDASSWDWTVMPWLLEAALSLRVELCDNMNDVWFDLATRRYKELFCNPELITSGGLVIRQLNPGVMKSGCVNTIADNSIMQVILHVRVCLLLGLKVEDLMTMGDDRLQKPFPEWDRYLEKTKEFCIIKSVKLANEFAGYEFRGNQVIPVHRGKHAFNLLHMSQEFEAEIADSYALNYHRSPYRNWMEKLFEEMGLKVLSRESRDLIFDGV